MRGSWEKVGDGEKVKDLVEVCEVKNVLVVGTGNDAGVGNGYVVDVAGSGRSVSLGRLEIYPMLTSPSWRDCRLRRSSWWRSDSSISSQISFVMPRASIGC